MEKNQRFTWLLYQPLDAKPDRMMWIDIRRNEKRAVALQTIHEETIVQGQALKALGRRPRTNLASLTARLNRRAWVRKKPNCCLSSTVL